MYSLKTKIFALSLALLVCLGVIFGVYSLITTVVYQKLRLESIRRTIKFETAQANTLVALIERSAVHLATNGYLCYLSQTPELGELSAIEMIRSFPAAIGGGFWFEPFAFRPDLLRFGIHAYRPQGTNDVQLDFIGADYDYHQLSWYREIIEKKPAPYHTVWIQPYLDDTTNKLVMTAGSGIYDQSGILLGISLIDWEVSEVIRELASIKPTENSIVMMYDHEHQFVIAHTYHQALPEITPVDNLPMRIPGTIEAASRTWKEIYDVGISLVVINNVQNLALSRKMNNGWDLLVYAPLNEIFLDTAQRNIFFTLAFVLGSVFLLWMAYRVLSKIVYQPIKSLNQSVVEISLGNLDVVTKVNTHDELGSLAQAFNQMAVDLKRSIAAYQKEHSEKERIATELKIAAEIQASMLPYKFPPFPERHEFDIYATMLPAKEVGGDFYDFFFIDHNTLALVMADVSGKGVPAALYMVITKILLENNASSGKTPCQVLEAVNKTLYQNNDTGMFVTIFLGYYHLLTGKLLYVNAGHNTPLCKIYEQPFRYHKTKPSNILGWKLEADFHEEEIYLHPGDILFLYTDGVTEATNPQYDLFSEARLLEIINKNQHLPPTLLLPAVQNELDLFAHGTEQADDITMLALQIKPELISPPKNLVVQATIDRFNEVIEFINDELTFHACPENLFHNIDLAVEEIFANIVNYAYENEPEHELISISIQISHLAIDIRFEDSGIPFNPLENPPPDLDVPLLERNIGGLGIFLVNKLMDQVQYERLNAKNILTITKNL